MAITRLTATCALALLLGRIPAQDTGEIGPIVIRGDRLQLTTSARGIPLRDFIRVAEQLTGKVFHYDARDVTADARISIAGTVSMQRGHFFAFFQTLLSSHGFATLIRDTNNTEIVEVVHLGLHGRGLHPFVAANELARLTAADGERVTLFEVQHAGARVVLDHIRKAMALTAEVSYQRVQDGVIMAHGPAPQLEAMRRMIQLIDIPTRVEATEIVSLDHTTSAEVATALRDLLGKRRPDIHILDAPRHKQLVVRGPANSVAEVRQLITLLDRPKHAK